MKCRGITSKSHRLEIQHMVLMRACFCHKFFPAPYDHYSQSATEINFSLQLSAHAALKITELFKTELLPALGMHCKAMTPGSVLHRATQPGFSETVVI